MGEEEEEFWDKATIDGWAEWQEFLGLALCDGIVDSNALSKMLEMNSTLAYGLKKRMDTQN